MCPPSNEGPHKLVELHPTVARVLGVCHSAATPDQLGIRAGRTTVYGGFASEPKQSLLARLELELELKL